VGNFGDYQTWQRWRLEEDHGLQLGKARHLLHSSSDMLFEFPLIWMEFTVSFIVLKPDPVIDPVK